MRLRVRWFVDLTIQTEAERSKLAPKRAHIQTMDTKIVQNLDLKRALEMDLIHIPFKWTNFSITIDTTLDAFV